MLMPQKFIVQLGENVEQALASHNECLYSALTKKMGMTYHCSTRVVYVEMK